MEDHQYNLRCVMRGMDNPETLSRRELKSKIEYLELQIAKLKEKKNDIESWLTEYRRALGEIDAFIVKVSPEQPFIFEIRP